MLARPLANKPNVISNTGPINPTRPVAITINFFVPSPRLLNLSRTFPTTLTTGVSAFKNASPIGISVSFSFSIDSLKLTPTAFSTVFNSRSDIIASSSTDAPASCKTLDA